ncbi:MAG: DUF1292 domain-containing protein [Oscillospiraceae bacterium]
MADNNVIYDENEGTVSLTDENGKTAVFYFYDETYIPLDDEEGVTTNFECISSMEYDGAVYYALLPEATEEDDEPEEFVVLRGEENDDELLLSSLDTEEENMKIGELFLKALFSLEDMSGDDDEILQ